MQEILAKITLGENVQSKGIEEKNFVQQVTVEIADIKKMGYEISIPGEWPDGD
jgi:hypothetical protein